MGEVIASQTLISCTSDVLPSRAREGSTLTSSWGVGIKTKKSQLPFRQLAGTSEDRYWFKLFLFCVSSGIPFPWYLICPVS